MVNGPERNVPDDLWEGDSFVVKLFGNVSQGEPRSPRSPASASQLMGYESTRDRCLGAAEERCRSGERWQAGGGVVGSGSCRVVDERGNEYLATTNDYCPARPLREQGSGSERSCFLPTGAPGCGVGFRVIGGRGPNVLERRREETREERGCVRAAS